MRVQEYKSTGIQEYKNMRETSGVEGSLIDFTCINLKNYILLFSLYLYT